MDNIKSNTNVSSLISPDILKNLSVSKIPKTFGDQLSNKSNFNVLESTFNSPISGLLYEQERLIFEGIQLEIEHKNTLLKLKLLNTPAQKVVNGQVVEIPPKLSNEEYELSVKNENINYEIAKKNIQEKKKKNNEDIKKFFKDPFQQLKSLKKKREEKRKAEKSKNRANRKKANKDKIKSTLKGSVKSLVPVIVVTLENILAKIIANSNNIKKLVDDTNIIIEEANTSNDILKLENAKLLRDNAIRIIQNNENLILKINENIKKISITINIFSIVVEIISSLPIPTSVPPGIGIPVSAIMQLVKILNKANQILLTLNAYLPIITTTLDKAVNILEDYKSQLLPINGYLDQQSIDKSENNSLISNPNQFGTITQTYKGFKFAIREENNPKLTVRGNKRHYAVAIDTNNVEVLKSESSFTLDPEDLINTLILIIDKEKLIA